MGFYLKTEIISETLVKKQGNEWCPNSNCINVPLSHTFKWKPKSPHWGFRRRRSYRKAWHAFRDDCVGNSDAWVNLVDWRVRRNHTCAAKMRWRSRLLSQQQGLSFTVNNGCSKFPKKQGTVWQHSKTDVKQIVSLPLQLLPSGRFYRHFQPNRLVQQQRSRLVSGRCSVRIPVVVTDVLRSSHQVFPGKCEDRFLLSPSSFMGHPIIRPCEV